MTAQARSATFAFVPPRARLSLLALLAGGCATVPSDPLVYLSFAGSSPCTVDVDEQRYTLPADSEPLARRLRSHAARRQSAIIDAGEEPPSFACYREAMTLVRRARFPRLGFVTAPPPDPAADQPRTNPSRPAPKRPG